MSDVLVPLWLAVVLGVVGTVASASLIINIISFRTIRELRARVAFLEGALGFSMRTAKPSPSPVNFGEQVRT